MIAWIERKIHVSKGDISIDTHSGSILIDVLDKVKVKLL